jgi:hypothetical protein
MECWEMGEEETLTFIPQITNEKAPRKCTSRRPNPTLRTATNQALTFGTLRQITGRPSELPVSASYRVIQRCSSNDLTGSFNLPFGAREPRGSSG